jgi:hypothetical protein
MSCQLHAPADLPEGKEPPVPIEQECGWSPELVWTRLRREGIPDLAGNQTPSGRGYEEKDSLTLPGIKTQSSSSEPSHCTDRAITASQVESNAINVVIQNESN